uniref:Carboxylic ester hydrolase n=1 Tax=Photinus pyralis TaxID=7054 RepID=A0A1Y1M050_PHOPY
MFYIHGGGFFEGTAQREEVGPELLMDKDIVLVTANYRLGPLGFFSTGDEVVPGNMGLKDQALALEWVANNIKHFGGNPKKVTVFGHSAGAASAHLHMFSNLSKDLINGVIAQSGTAFSRWALAPSKELRNHSLTLAEIAGCKRGTSKDLINCLKVLKGTDILKAAISLHENIGTRLIYFRPTIEVNATGAFLSDAPTNIAKSGKVARVPFITGATAQDGAMFVPDILAGMPATNRQEYLEKTLPLFLWYLKAPNVTKSIRDHYLGTDPENFSSLELLIKMCTDVVFLEAAYESIQIHSTHSSQVYYYLFEYQGSETFAKRYKIDQQFVVTHGDELPYLFNNTVLFPGYVPTWSDKKMIELLTTLWTDFAKYGEPTPNEDKLLSVHWKTFEGNKQYFYHIKNDTTAVCETDLLADAPRIWSNS